ncbi:MAG: MATE family efflux transporter [Rubrivivax sp.]|nr:MATE family efflux transporter [Rubrivivax sp.]
MNDVPLARGLRGELKTMARDAGAVFAGQIAIMGFGVTDTIVAGRHSDLSLAALAIGSAVFITVFISLTGLVTALLPVWAEMNGAREPWRVGPSVRQALYVCAAASLAGMAVLLHPEPILHATQVPQDMRPVAAQYLAVIGWSLPAALLFRVFSTLSQALGRPQLVSWLQVIALAAKVPLSVWLAFGGAGVPEMGVVGCAWASFIVQWLLLALALWLLRTQSIYVPLALWRRVEPPHGPTLAAFARLGVPAALTILVEITSFTMMALFIARLGTSAAAAHQVAANVTALLYMVPLSLAIAASARVGYWRGAGNETMARAVALRSVWVSLGLALVLAAGLLATRSWVVEVYTTHADVALLAVQLLVWVALLHVADGAQTVAIFLLRCWRVTVAPFVIYGVVLWGVGLLGGYLLAYRGIGPVEPLRSPVAFWMASACALLLVAGLVQWLLRRTCRRAVAGSA